MAVRLGAALVLFSPLQVKYLKISLHARETREHGWHNDIADDTMCSGLFHHSNITDQGQTFEHCWWYVSTCIEVHIHMYKLLRSFHLLQLPPFACMIMSSLMHSTWRHAG